MTVPRISAGTGAAALMLGLSLLTQPHGVAAANSLITPTLDLPGRPAHKVVRRVHRGTLTGGLRRHRTLRSRPRGCGTGP